MTHHDGNCLTPRYARNPTRDGAASRATRTRRRLRVVRGALPRRDCLVDASPCCSRSSDRSAVARPHWHCARSGAHDLWWHGIATARGTIRTRLAWSVDPRHASHRFSRTMARHSTTRNPAALSNESPCSTSFRSCRGNAPCASSTARTNRIGDQQ